MEVTTIRVNVVEDMETTMAKFLNDLDCEIVNVELQHYIELEDMAHIATKVKTQFKRKSITRQDQNSSSFFKWRSNYRGEGVAQTKLIMGDKIKSCKSKKNISTDIRGKSDT
jgi:hypothetical protein